MFRWMDEPEQPRFQSLLYACFKMFHKDWKTKCLHLFRYFVPFWRCPACSSLLARAWSSSWCSSGWPCCAIFYPPASCGRYWPAVKQYHRCSGWWSKRKLDRIVKDCDNYKWCDLSPNSTHLRTFLFMIFWQHIHFSVAVNTIFRIKQTLFCFYDPSYHIYTHFCPWKSVYKVQNPTRQ